MNQEKHHRYKIFSEEYEGMLKEYAIKYDNRYIFEWLQKTGG
jgi:hypothetical protein